MCVFLWQAFDLGRFGPFWGQGGFGASERAFGVSLAGQTDALCSLGGRWLVWLALLAWDGPARGAARGLVCWASPGGRPHA